MSVLQALAFWTALGAVFVLGWMLGSHVGYQRGFDDCEFEHDFDRCPHCKRELP